MKRTIRELGGVGRDQGAVHGRKDPLTEVGGEVSCMVYGHVYGLYSAE
jgi:hypothetical protein